MLTLVCFGEMFCSVLEISYSAYSDLCPAVCPCLCEARPHEEALVMYVLLHTGLSFSLTLKTVHFCSVITIKTLDHH